MISHLILDVMTFFLIESFHRNLPVISFIILCILLILSFLKNLLITIQSTVYQICKYLLVTMIKNHLHGIRLEEFKQVFHQFLQGKSQCRNTHLFKPRTNTLGTEGIE